MTKKDLIELTITEVTAIINIAAAGLASRDMRGASAMRGTASSLQKKKAEIAKNILEAIGGE